MQECGEGGLSLFGQPKIDVIYMRSLLGVRPLTHGPMIRLIFQTTDPFLFQPPVSSKWQSFVVYLNASCDIICLCQCRVMGHVQKMGLITVTSSTEIHAPNFKRDIPNRRLFFCLEKLSSPGLRNPTFVANTVGFKVPQGT